MGDVVYVTKHHAARLRRGDADKSSFSDSGTPSSRAIASNGRCQSPGILLRFPHCQTALRPSPRWDAIAPSPPSRSISVMAFMGTDSTIPTYPAQVRSVPSGENRQFRWIAPDANQSQRRNVGTERTHQSKDFDEAVVQRVEGLLRDMGWDELVLAEQIYRVMGYSGPKAVKQWFQRAESRRIPPLGIRVIADELGIDAAYLLGCYDDIAKAVRLHGKYELATRNMRRTAR